MTDHETPRGARPGPATHFAPGVIDAQRPARARAIGPLVYGVVEGYRPLELDVFVPAAADVPAPAVIWIHGGGFLTGSRRFPPLEWEPGVLFQTITDAGFAVVSIDYRHSGEAPFPAQLHDGKAAIRYVRRYASELGIDPERIAVWGESAGGQLAALLGLVSGDDELEGAVGVVGESSEVTAVVDFYGISDVARVPRFGETFPPEVRAMLAQPSPMAADIMATLLHDSPLAGDRRARAASPVSHARVDAPPFLLVHGDSDLVVPLEHSVILAERLRAVGSSVELVVVPAANHVFWGSDPGAEFARAIAFLQSHMP